MKHDETIFISIASYRDVYLQNTIASALKNATNSSRLRFGIYWQADDSERLDNELIDERFKIERIHYTKSKGVCHARAQIQKYMFQGEDYHLMTDSHMEFKPGWDVSLINQLKSKPSDKCLLTCFSPHFDWDKDKNIIYDDNVYYIRGEEISDGGYFNLQMAKEKSPGPNTQTPYFCANFCFVKGDWIDNVPYDEELYYSGEEITMAVRSWTHGYDLYLPDKAEVFHIYYRYYPDNKRLKHWDERDQKQVHACEAKSYKRQHILLYDEGDHAELGKFGLGSARSRDEWEKFADVSLKEKKIHSTHW